MIDDEEEQWKRWIDRCRDHPPPAGLADRTMNAVAAVATQSAISTSRASSMFAERIAPYLLWSAAAVMCAARLYGTLGLLVPDFAFTSNSVRTVQGVFHVELVASDD